MSDTLVSIIRTFVPTVVGAFLSWLLTLGITVDDSARTALVTGLTAVLTAAYYALVRAAEKRWPWVGVLLGVPRAPSYAESNEAAQVASGKLDDLESEVDGTPFTQPH